MERNENPDRTERSHAVDSLSSNRIYANSLDSLNENELDNLADNNLGKRRI